MTAATCEERTGRALMDPHDFATTVRKISLDNGVSVYHASIALDQAIAFVVTVAAVSLVRRENLRLSEPVDAAWRAWLSNPLLYAKIEPLAGAYVDRIPMMDPAQPEHLARTAQVIEAERFKVYPDAWHKQRGAYSIGLVPDRLAPERPVTPVSA